jgi:membrane protein CcdC involved in cytochrome C biogenesis
MALAVIFIRLKAIKKPATVMKIIMPPIGMSTGFLMFAAPSVRIPVEWAIAAFAVGAVFFAYPLIRTSTFYFRDSRIYLHRSRAFVWILLTLLLIRMVLHRYVEEWVSLPQTAALFFLLAFGMLVPWRIAMFVRFRKLQRQPQSSQL